MKKILAILTILIVTASVAKADACSASLVPAFVGQQAVILCDRGLRNVSTRTNFETVAGTGTNQATAAPLSALFAVKRLTGANGTVAWLLPVVTASDIGDQFTLLNTTAGVANLFPQTGGTINGAAADAVFAALTGIKPIICYVTAAATWICA